MISVKYVLLHSYSMTKINIYALIHMQFYIIISLMCSQRVGTAIRCKCGIEESDLAHVRFLPSSGHNEIINIGTTL